MELSGSVERIVYSNEGNGYAILEVQLTTMEVDRLREAYPEGADDIYDEMTVVGTLAMIRTGVYATFTGDFTRHASYGLQFKAVSYEEQEPEDLDSIEHYLGSGAIRGVGPVLAGKIVKKFKLDTFRIMEEEPEKLAQIKGISGRMAIEIADQVREKKAMRQAMIYLGELGIGMNLAVKIYKEYGEKLYEILETNPYRLADDIKGVGFKIADDIAKSIGVEEDAPSRLKSGILYTLNQAVGAGHTYVPLPILLERAENVLGVPISDTEDLLVELMMDHKIMIKEADGEKAVYSAALYKAELSVARQLIDLNVSYPVDERSFGILLSGIERREELELDGLQQNAVKVAAANGLLIITGGPGTGKTTTINTIIKFFEEKDAKILLAAPTGRAAKRMTEATAREAQTIHRLLEISGLIDEDDRSGDAFGRNQDNPLEADVVIIDEMSMVDIFLMNSLLKAISVGTRLILVGDADQLPSVGPGAVLKDIIASERFPVVKLTKIFRQEEAGDIVNNAHRINQGETFPIGPSSKDFPFIRRTEADAIINACVTLIRDKLPGYVNCQPNEVQVLTPTRKGNLGVERLNVVLQQYLNPPDRDRTERQIGDTLFREGDKVMQIKNDYNLAWEVRGYHGIPIETGMGVFNGDTGIVDEIDTVNSQLTVHFDDNKYVIYTFGDVEELEHAYAVTVHKSQGSEYPAVVLPLLDGPRMLMNRNILYTAVTRAKQCICVVGDENTFYAMITNENEQKRWTSLKERIEELAVEPS